MFLMPENRILRTLLIGSTVAVVICYAWLTARLMEPQFSTPAFVSDTFIRTPEARIFLFEEKFRELPREAAHLSSELGSLDPLLTWLGPLKQPIEILVDEKQADRLLVTDSRLEIGRDVLLAHGQLKKSVLKAWLLQHASIAVISSQLRLDVASDVLLAMLEGGLSLRAPELSADSTAAVNASEALKFDENDRDWFSYADTYSGVCKSEWRSLELAPLCSLAKGDAISALSFRPFLGGRIWKSYQAISFRDRLAFIRRWVKALEKPRLLASPNPDVASLASLSANPKAGWPVVLSGELEVLLPSEMDPLARERADWPTAVKAPLIVIDRDGRLQAPGTLRVVTPELPIASASLAQITTCDAPSVGHVLSISVPAERVVWRPECAERKSDFIQVRPSAIRLAVARGLAANADRLDAFVLSPNSSKASSLLGLTDAKWIDRLDAFQVRGAIQAVEMYRLGSRGTMSGATTSLSDVETKSN
jgi:hypothetical protein